MTDLKLENNIIYFEFGVFPLCRTVTRMYRADVVSFVINILL
jgi:hypothetical protein